jgi:hypothetical protein
MFEIFSKSCTTLGNIKRTSNCSESGAVSVRLPVWPPYWPQRSRQTAGGHPAREANTKITVAYK